MKASGTYFVELAPLSRAVLRKQGVAETEIERRIAALPFYLRELVAVALELRDAVGLPLDVPFDVFEPEVRLPNERQLRAKMGHLTGIVWIDGRVIFRGLNQDEIRRFRASAPKAKPETGDA